MIRETKDSTGAAVNRGVKATRKQLRGSGLLLFGRLLSVGANFAAQVLVVRYFSQSDYGAWTYCLALVALFQQLTVFGLDRSITRFIPIYHEQHQYDKLFGTIFLALSVILAIGLSIVLAVHFAPDFAAKFINNDSNPISLLLILVFLAPIQAIDGMLIGLFASFGQSRSIFFRRYIIAPLLKLSAVLLLLGFEEDLHFLGYGFVFVTLLGLLIYIPVLLRLLRTQGLLQEYFQRNVTVPWREVFGFTLPLLTSDLVMILMHSSDTLMLGYFHGTASVALYQVILPAAAFNTLVRSSFALLYTPTAARLFAKEDYVGIKQLYWRTAIWLGVLSFPLFALTFAMAEPLTLFLYGERYEQSWVFLQMLAFAYYFNVILGYNGLTLKVLGKIRYVVTINVAVMVLNVILNLLLIPAYGALGAAIATAVSMLVHNILKQAGLGLAIGVGFFCREHVPFYLFVVVGTAILVGIQKFATNNLVILIPVAGAMFLLAIRLFRRKLEIEETFPEVLKIPIMRLLFASQTR